MSIAGESDPECDNPGGRAAMMEGRHFADRFRILKTLGANGATEVSLAQDDQLGELVALRVLSAGFADRWEILRDACRDARQLSHPNIARVFDFYRDEDSTFICREYIEGASIADFSGRSTAEELAVFTQVVAALELAHGLGVVHGDLKASKILRDVRGNVRLIDFRVAAALRAAVSMTGNDHISPQVRMGETPVAADDIYALGIVIAQTIPPERATGELGELIGAMSAEPREARLTDLREIKQRLTALSTDAEKVLEAHPPIVPSLRPAAASSLERDEPQASLGNAGPPRNLQYAMVAGILALAALLVFVALPRWVESSGALESPSESMETGDEVVSPPTQEVSHASESSVESLLAQIIPLREELESSAVERWARADYSNAKELEGRGDAAFLERDYAAAQADYAEALMIYEALSGQRFGVLETSLETGAIALEAGDQARAIEAFDLALAIEPRNATALAGASKADGLGALLDHMSAGKVFETNGDLDSAHGEYAKALEIDPQYAPAIEHLARVESAQADNDYESDLSLALVSLAKGNLGTARTHFERARKIRPDSPEVADGLRQLQQIESSHAIASLRERAEAAEAAEKWSEAASHYQTIVETQDNLSFAEEGLERNRELARISGGIAKLLDDPTQLFRPKTLEEARDLLQLGRQSSEGIPRLAEQVRNLEIAVQLASTPISVAFESDTVTEVLIRGVGTLGNFSRRDVPLKPGRYVVVGRRNGYRDTRSEILVVPGVQQPVVEVRCTDEI
jgi:serine/threonine protein kinase/Tfp pilus assembly protein PilF